MSLKVNELTPEAVTNLYLYGQITRPADLTNDALLRPGGSRHVVSVDERDYTSSAPPAPTRLPAMPATTGSTVAAGATR
jgi:hypothetical protein